MSEITTENSPGKLTSGLNRRAFLKSAALASSALVVNAAIGKLRGSSIINKKIEVLDDNLSREERTELLKKQIEQTYDIDIIGPQERQTVDIFSSQLSTIEWKDQELKILSRALKDLPPHFYLPDHGNKLLFTIVNSEGWKGESSTDNKFIMWCDCFADVKLDVVAIESRYMESGGDESSRSAITHELTHRVFNFSKPDNLVYEVDGRSRLSNVNIWNTDLERVGKELDELIKKDPEKMFENLNFRSILRYGVQNWNEFVATAGQTYILGRSHFVNSYGEYFDPVTSGKLYDFMKEQIFRGKEY